MSSIFPWGDVRQHTSSQCLPSPRTPVSVGGPLLKIIPVSRVVVRTLEDADHSADEISGLGSQARVLSSRLPGMREHRQE